MLCYMLCCVTYVMLYNIQLCFKSFKFWRRQSRNDWKTSKQCGNASARGIFDYGGSARTSRENAIRNCIQHVRSNWIRISFSKDFLLFATKPFQSKKVCLIFSSALEVSYSFWNKQAAAFFSQISWTRLLSKGLKRQE